MTMHTVTQWFQGVSPFHPGEYEVRNDGTLSRRSSKFLVGSRKRYWTGTVWLTEKGGQLSVMGSHHSHQWRGLAEPPVAERRPGTAALAYQLHQENPAWSYKHCMGTAKAQLVAQLLTAEAQHMVRDAMTKKRLAC